MSPVAAGTSERFGQVALDAVGARLAVTFLVAAGAGIVVAGWWHDPGRLLLCLALVPACAGLALLALPHRRTGILLTALVLLAVALVLALDAPPRIMGHQPTTEVVAWVIVAVSGGIAASRGPAVGILAYLCLAGSHLVAARSQGTPVPLGPVAGALTYTIGASLVHVLARRGFATTARELAGTEAAEAARRVAQARWTARREGDRLLHDTVLATLTVLAHRGEGVEDAALQRAAARDVRALRSGSLAPAEHHHGSSAPAPPAGSDPIDRLVASLQRDAERLGLQLAVHRDPAAAAARALPEGLGAPLADALGQCLVNVARHAGTTEVDLAVTVTTRSLVLVLGDRGRGFDPSAVPPERLGLQGSVVERLHDVGATATVWSRPGAGTAVVIGLPLPDGPPP